MRLFLGELWQDESASVLITEWACVATILMLGILSAAIARSRTYPFSEEGGSASALTGGPTISAAFCAGNGRAN